MSNNYNLSIAPALENIQGAGFVSGTDGLKAASDRVQAVGANIVLMKMSTDKMDPRLPDYGIIGIIEDAVFTYGASDDLIIDNDSEVSEGGTTYVKKKEIYCPVAGTFRIKFKGKKTAAGGNFLGRIYVNGAGHGTERNTGETTYQEWSEDLVFAKDDLIQLYIKNSNGVNIVYAIDFRIYGVVTKTYHTLAQFNNLL